MLGARFYRPKTVEIKADDREDAKIKFKEMYKDVKITEILEKEQKHV